MSTTVDSRVVEMRFDNKHFESNVQTTMSTLDKLKQKLNLSGAAKGLDDVNAAAKNVNMTGLGTAVDTVRAKFSALEIIGVTALANIANQAVNVGKRMISALTIDPIKTGFQEYETQINATQTILANVGHKGKTLEDVNAALEELNEYADQTIYNFTEMTKNIGLFTNAGIGLDESVTAIKGFSNAAAMAGTDATKTAGAMYQLSQAMSSGVVQLMDWRSLEQANITGERFQETIKMTARAHGIAIDDMIAKEGNFRNTLKNGWLTADLMSEALNHYTLSTETMTEAEIKANRERLRSLGYTEEQIDKLFELGTEANNAATKVKTFSQLWDVLKESAQSGWSKTWKILIGDFEQAKNFLTPLSEALTGFLDKISKARNDLLESALGKGFVALSEKIQTVIKPALNTADSIKTVVDAVKDYTKVVDEIINGNWGNGQERWDKLTEAGYDWAHAQNLVNEKLGVSLRRETKYQEAQKESAKTQDKLNETEAKRIAQLAEMSDAQLRSLGYSDKQIQAFRDLKEAADKLGMPLDEFIEKIDEIDGRWLILNSFKNAGNGLVKVFTAIKDAWQEVFPPKSIEERSEQIFNIITALHKFSRSLIMEDETADKLKRTFKGLFAVLDIVSTLTAGPLKIAFKVISSILGYFNLDILDVTAAVGDAIVKFSDWLDKVVDFDGVVAKVIPYLQSAAKATKEWFGKLKESERIKQLIDWLRDGVDTVKSWFDAWRNGEDIPNDVINGLVNGLTSGAKKIWDAAVELAKGLWEGFCDFMGIQSPSKKMEEGGEYAMEGLVNGLQNGASGLWECLKGIADKIVGFIRGIDFSKVMSLLVSGALLFFIGKIASFIGSIGSVFDGVGDVLENFAGVVKTSKKVVKAFAGVLKSISAKIYATALKDIAVAIAILVGSIALLTFLDTKKVLISAGVIIAFVAALTTLVKNLGSMDEDGAVKIAKTVGLLWSLVGAVAILAIVAKILGGMELEELGMAAMAMSLVLFVMTILATIAMIPAKEIGSTLLQMAGVMAILTVVVKILGDMEPEELGMAAMAMGILVTAMLILAVIAMIPAKEIGSTLLQMAGALAILTIVVKLLGDMELEELGMATMAMSLVLLAMTILATIAMIPTKKMGSTLLQMAGAMAILAIVAKILGSMEWGDMRKAAAGLLGLVGVITLLMLVTKKASDKELKRLGTTLIAMSIAIGILAAVATLLGLLDVEHLKKGLIAVGVLSLMMSVMIASTKNATNCWQAIVAMAASIAVLAVAVAALSFIDPKSLGIATACLGALMGMFALMAKASGSSSKSTGAIVAMAATIAVIAYSIYELSQLPIASTIAASAALSVMLLALAGAMKIISKVDNIKIGPLAIMVVAIGIIGGMIYLIGKLPIASTIAAAITLSVMLLALAGAMAIISKVDKIKIAPLATMIVAVGLLGGLIYLLSPLPISSTLGAVLALSVMLLALSGAMAILSGIKSVSVSVIIAMLAAATALVMLAEVVAIIGTMSGGAVLTSLLAIGGALAILAIGLNVMNGTLAGSAALLIAAVALNALAPALMLLGGMSLAEIGSALLVLAGAFVILGVAGLLLGPVAPAIIALSAALLITGAAVALFGIGIQAIATGLNTMSASALVNVPIFITALSMLIQGIITLIPMVVNAMGIFIVSLLQTIAKYIPDIVQAGCDIILGLLEGIAKNISKIVQAAIDVILGFIDGVSKKLPDIIQSGIELAISFINGLADGIRNNQADMEAAVDNLMDAVITAIKSWFNKTKEKGSELVEELKAGLKEKISDAKEAAKGVISDMIDAIKTKLSDWKTAGKDMMDGFKQGVKDKANAIIEAAKGVVSDALQAAKNLLGIKSPSREFAEIGRWSDMGLVVGLNKYAGKVITSAENVASGALKAMSSTIAGISDIVNSDIDSQPTIRPVLDLDDLRAGAGLINGMFSMTPSVGLIANVGSINAMMNRRRQNGANDDVVSAINDLKSSMDNRPGDTYTFGNVTYGDDSAVSEAVQSLIRAIRTERRT